MRRLRALTVQAHHPRMMPAATTRPSVHAGSVICKAMNKTQPHSVPAVPGATGTSPEPNPSPSRCAGWLKTKAHPGGRGTGAGEGGMVCIIGRPLLQKRTDASGTCALMGSWLDLGRRVRSGSGQKDRCVGNGIVTRPCCG